MERWLQWAWYEPFLSSSWSRFKEESKQRKIPVTTVGNRLVSMLMKHIFINLAKSSNGSILASALWITVGQFRGKWPVPHESGKLTRGEVTRLTTAYATRILRGVGNDISSISFRHGTHLKHFEKSWHHKNKKQSLLDKWDFRNKLEKKQGN